MLGKLTNVTILTKESQFPLADVYIHVATNHHLVVHEQSCALHPFLQHLNMDTGRVEADLEGLGITSLNHVPKG